MKFKKYINEDFKNLLDILNDDCKPYLKDWKETGFTDNGIKGLYSGRRHSSNHIIKTVRKNRKPADTPKQIHDFNNAYFKNKFGVYLRSETLFTTGDYIEASEYGGVYYAIPLGKYEIYWNPDIQDLYSFSRMSLFIEDEQVKYRDDFTEKIFKRKITRYKKGDLWGAIHSMNEVMMHTKKVLLVKETNDNDDIILEAVDNI